MSPLYCLEISDWSCWRVVSDLLGDLPHAEWSDEIFLIYAVPPLHVIYISTNLVLPTALLAKIDRYCKHTIISINEWDSIKLIFLCCHEWEKVEVYETHLKWVRVDRSLHCFGLFTGLVHYIYSSCGSCMNCLLLWYVNHTRKSFYK